MGPVLDECELAKLPPGSDMQQAAIVAIQEEDPYNWGYNPVLWGVPKGSYASNPDGPSRIVEYRQMVQALNRLGLRVVMDVVYNHLNSSGPFGVSSVLDKIVVRCAPTRRIRVAVRCAPMRRYRPPPSRLLRTLACLRLRGAPAPRRTSSAEGSGRPMPPVFASLGSGEHPSSLRRPRTHAGTEPPRAV